MGRECPTTRQQEEALWTDDTSVDVLSLSPGHPAPISTGHRQSGHRAGTGVTPGANHMDPPHPGHYWGPTLPEAGPRAGPQAAPAGIHQPLPKQGPQLSSADMQAGVMGSACPVLQASPWTTV